MVGVADGGTMGATAELGLFLRVGQGFGGEGGCVGGRGETGEVGKEEEEEDWCEDAEVAAHRLHGRVHEKELMFEKGVGNERKVLGLMVVERGFRSEFNWKLE